MLKYKAIQHQYRRGGPWSEGYKKSTVFTEKTLLAKIP